MKVKNRKLSSLSVFFFVLKVDAIGPEILQAGAVKGLTRLYIFHNRAQHFNKNSGIFVKREHIQRKESSASWTEHRFVQTSQPQNDKSSDYKQFKPLEPRPPLRVCFLGRYRRRMFYVCGWHQYRSCFQIQIWGRPNQQNIITKIS